MKIRPLHKIEQGYYESRDKQWRFLQKLSQGESIYRNIKNIPENREWWAYRRLIDGKFYKDTPYFFSPYPTLKSLIEALEKAKP